MSSLVFRFSESVSRFETTQQRLKDIAEFLSVSQNKAAAYAINKTWESLAEQEDMLEELEFKRHGRKVGKVTYLNHDEDAIRRIEERIANGVPLPHEDDDTLERNLLFRLLTTEQQDRVKTEQDPLMKRQLIVRFIKQNKHCPSDPAINR